MSQCFDNNVVFAAEPGLESSSHPTGSCEGALRF